jgi:hypothetical protein
MVDGGGVTSTPGRRRRHDKMQEGATDSGAWSPSLIASRQGEGRRLGVVRTPVAQVVDDSVVELKDWTNQKRHDVRLREGKGMVHERGLGIPAARRNRRITAVVAATSGGQFWAAWGLSGGNGRGETEREAGATYRHGRGVELSEQ